LYYAVEAVTTIAEQGLFCKKEHHTIGLFCKREHVKAVTTIAEPVRAVDAIAGGYSYYKAGDTIRL